MLGMAHSEAMGRIQQIGHTLVWASGVKSEILIPLSLFTSGSQRDPASSYAKLGRTGVTNGEAPHTATVAMLLVRSSMKYARPVGSSRDAHKHVRLCTAQSVAVERDRTLACYS